MKNKLPWDLIISKLRQELTPEQETSFNSWLEKGENYKLFQQLQIVWENVQNKVSNYEPDLEYYWKELSARIEATEKNKTRRIKFNRRFSRIAAIATILLVTTFFCAYYLGQYNSDKAQKYITYSTLNSKSKVLLPDSTQVWLHNNSSLTYNYNKKTKQREVTFNGEAYFDVYHNADKPFHIQTGEVEIKVHGTEFNVSAYPHNEKVLVSLYQGSVSMQADNHDIILKPGEEGHYDIKTKQITISEGDVEFAKIWTTDKIRFEDKSLREVCKYLSKWYGIKFDIDSTITDDQSYTFTFRGQSLGEVVEIITSIQSFDYHINEENNVVTIKN